MDERGRVTIGTKIAKRYGRRFYVIKAPNEIILIPKPKDPIKDLMELGKKAGFKNMTPEKIRKEAEEQAYKEIDAKPKRIKSRLI